MQSTELLLAKQNFHCSNGENAMPECKRTNMALREKISTFFTTLLQKCPFPNNIFGDNDKDDTT